MSIEQLAIDTKIPRASIEALEEDRFGALPGPVFVKGFFRCCSRSLELDAETVLALLHEHERALAQLKSGRRERQTPHLLGRATTAARPEPARNERTDAGSSSSSRPGSATAARTPSPTPAPAAAAGNAVSVPAAPALFNFDALMPAIRRVVLSASNSRLLMWIAIGLMIAVIVTTAFMMVGGPSPMPRS